MIKYKKTEKDLGYTIIENIFINDFMPSADGAFVKVYLMGLKLLQRKQRRLHKGEKLGGYLRHDGIRY